MWKSFGHFLASVAKKILAVNAAAQKDKAVIEGATALVPVYGPLAVGIEDAAFAVLGEVAACITAGGAAAEQHLANAGMNANVIATAKAVASGVVNLEDVAKALPKAA